VSDLFNTVLAALAQPRKGIFSYLSNSSSEASRRMCQQGLIGSQKFVVSDSLLEHAVVASFVKPKSLVEMCELAIPAFQNMWIEWNEIKRMELLKEHGTWNKYFAEDFEWLPEKWGLMVGYHIWQEPTLEQFCYSQYTLDPDTKMVMVPPMAFVMRNDEELDPRDVMKLGRRYSTKPDQPIDVIHKQQDHYGPTLIGQPYVDKHAGSPYLEQMYRRMNPAISNAGNMMLPKGVLPETERKKIAQQSSIVYAGDMRFLIAVLALLNYPHTVKERKVETGVRRMLWGRNVPRNELKIIEIDLPKPRGTTGYERMFKGGGGQKRRHVRRGHWRKFIHADGTMTTRWIGEQWVGSAELGTITHDYELKSKGAKGGSILRASHENLSGDDTAAKGSDAQKVGRSCERGRADDASSVVHKGGGEREERQENMEGTPAVLDEDVRLV